jgi:CheY-like chemotaxis protein
VADVLIVEDDADLLRILGRLLAANGHRVGLAADGEQGLALLRAGRFDLMLTDILMPVREGIETIIAVKAEAPQTRIIAMSGGARLSADDCLDLARSLGADAVLAKPFAGDTLLRLVDELLGPTRAAWPSPAERRR